MDVIWGGRYWDEMDGDIESKALSSQAEELMDEELYIMGMGSGKRAFTRPGLQET